MYLRIETKLKFHEELSGLNELKFFENPHKSDPSKFH